MYKIEKEICDLGQQKQLKDLQEYTKNLDDEELEKVIKERLFSSNFVTFWDYLLQSFTDSPIMHRKRLRAVLTLLKELEQSSISNSVCSQLVNRICPELPNFLSEHLIQLCQFCIECIQKGHLTEMCWKDLLPELLNVISERTCIEHNSVEISGLEYKTQLITSLCMIQWSPEIVTSLTSMFNNMSLTKEEHLQVVNKLGDYVEKLTCQELPAFVYQLLKFCRHQNSRSIFLRLQNYFGTKVYAKINNNSESSSEKDSMDVIGDSLEQEMIQVESTILYYIYQCATYGHDSISDYLSSLKKMTKSPEFILHPFQLSVLLTISCVSTFQVRVFEVVRSSIYRFLHEENKKKDSCWIRDMVPASCKVEDVFSQIIDISFRERELVIEGLVNLGFELLGIGSALGRDLIAERQWHLGTNILIKIIHKKRNIASCIIQRLSNYIVVGQNVSQYIGCIDILSSKMSLMMLENQSCVVELMERIVQVPCTTANSLLDAILPLTKLSPTMRDHLIVMLKKALYSRKSDTRRVAVSGFLKLLKNLKVSNLAALSQSSSSSFSSGQSLMTQISLTVHTGQARPTIISNEALTLELLGVLRRCFMQQAEVRAQLYKGLYDTVCMNFELALPALDIIWIHFKEFYMVEEEELPPLKFSKITLSKDVNVILQEPLAQLIHTICMIVVKVLENDENEPTAIRYKEVLDSLCTRMTNCELIHFELDDGTDLLDIMPESQEKLITLKEALSVYEVLIGFKINIWNVGSENIGQQVKSLFDAYKRLLDFSKNLSRNKKVDKRKKADATQATQKSSPKGDSSQKAKVFKMSDTLLNLETLKRILDLLHRPEVDWATSSQANLLKTKVDFHRFVMQAALQLIQSFNKSSSIENQYKQKHFESITAIANVLYERCISRLDDFIDFDSVTAVLAAECFQTILSVVFNQYERHLQTFLSKVSGKDSAEVPFLLSTVMQVFQELLEMHDTDETQDLEIKKVSALIVSTLALLASHLPSENAVILSQFLDWMKKYSDRKTFTNKQVAQNFITLLFEVHLKCKSSLNFFERFVKRLCEVIGPIDEDEEVEKIDGLKIIDELTAFTALQCLCSSLKIILDEIDWIIVRLGAEYNMLMYPGETGTERKREYLKSKERGVCCQLCPLISIIEILCSINVPLGTLSETIIKVLSHLFNTLNSLTRHFIVRSSKVNLIFQSARFERVVKLAGKNFFGVVYKFIMHIENDQPDEKAAQTKKRKVDSNVLKNRVLKETKLIPKLIYEMEQFGKSVIQLSKKTKVDLNKYIGQGAARDFRIKGLKEALQEIDVAPPLSPNETTTNSTVEHEEALDNSDVTANNDDTSEVENSPPLKKAKV